MNKQKRAKYILIAPTLIFFVGITIFPLVYNIVMSLCQWKLGSSPRFIGLGNYEYAFTNKNFWRTMWNTVIITFFSVTLEYILGMILSYNINKLVHGKKLIRIMMLIPMMMAPVVIGFMWKQMFNELYGPLNFFLRILHLPTVTWISQKGYSLFSIILVDIWEWTPFVTIILLAGFQSIPIEPIESARVDGATEWQIFRDIIFKMLIPSSTVAIILRAIETFKIFDTIYIITAGGPGISSMSASMYAYQIGLRNFNVGKAAAMCVIMLAFVLIVSQIVQRIHAARIKKIDSELANISEEDFSVYS